MEGRNLEQAEKVAMAAATHNTTTVDFFMRKLTDLLSGRFSIQGKPFTVSGNLNPASF
jgi:hypothetical protein